MPLKPFTRMLDRINTAKEESESSLFLVLLYTGEMITKVIASELIAAIQDDRDRQRYRQLHRLVRADGLGEWVTAIDEVLVGPATQHLILAAGEEKHELTGKCGAGTWQHDAIILLLKVVKIFDPAADELPTRIEGRRWFSLFAKLRNLTRGHGAHQSEKYSRACSDLEKSLHLIIENYVAFRRSWVYLHRSLSGKYRVTRITDDTSPFDLLRSTSGHNYPDGVYVHLDRHTRVDLLNSDADTSDFFFPNGGFRGKKFELISYITGSVIEGDATPYMAPATELAASETQGVGILDPQGKCFGNLPTPPSGYIRRRDLESELRERLIDERHPVLTLVGRGGIGKTSLALSVLHEITELERFGAILWFSSRDIDLLPEGPKLVRPHVLDENDIAAEFIRLMKPAEASTKGFQRLSYLAAGLSKSPIGSPLLFVFDNFETVRNPAELFTWIDTYIRPPNKVLITVRHREFKGDYPVEVMGMTESECEELISLTSRNLGINPLITKDYRELLYKESDGHPYVIKVFLGEVAKEGRLVAPKRIIASKDEILDALFERTFVKLSPVAKRTFLTLCNWRSTIPQLAVEAVLLRPDNEMMDVETAIEELRRCSFIEVTTSTGDNTLFISVPLAASMFGERKLGVSPLRSKIESDTALLQAFGSGQRSDIRHGVSPRIEKLFQYVAVRVGKGQDNLDSHLPMLEFIAGKYQRAWLILATLHEETGNFEKSKEALGRYLENSPRDPASLHAWQRLGDVCRKTQDISGELHALTAICELPDTPFSIVSNAANRVNAMLSQNYAVVDNDERKIVVSRLTEVMEARIGEANATDYSRLAWLCLRLKDEVRARKYCKRGLDEDQSNEYCQNLANRLG